MKEITKLYHYSKERYDALKTREAQGIIDNTRSTLRPDYNQTMSLFLEPVPLDIMGTIFKKGYNDFWYTGNRIWEYEVLIKNMPEFTYEIVESPIKNDMWNNPETKDMADKEWDELLYKRQLAAGEFGNNKKEFIKAAIPYVGILREEYIKLTTVHKGTFMVHQNYTKYAPCCVHVMVKPKGGIVHYDSAKQVVIGNNPIRIATESILDKW